MSLSPLSLSGDVIPILNRYALRHVVHLIHAHESARQLKHVVPQGDNDKLCVLGALFNVRCHDGDLLPYQLCFKSLPTRGEIKEMKRK